jgi:hypothetical protein
MVTPIPKGKKLPKAPTNFRPISVSTTFANINEILILQNGAQILKKMDSNQFDYQENISCKQAYCSTIFRNYELVYGASYCYLFTLDNKFVHEKVEEVTREHATLLHSIFCFDHL